MVALTRSQTKEERQRRAFETRSLSELEKRDLEGYLSTGRSGYGNSNGPTVPIEKRARLWVTHAKRPLSPSPVAAQQESMKRVRKDKDVKSITETASAKPLLHVNTAIPTTSDVPGSSASRSSKELSLGLSKSTVRPENGRFNSAMARDCEHIPETQPDTHAYGKASDREWSPMAACAELNGAIEEFADYMGAVLTKPQGALERRNAKDEGAKRVWMVDRGGSIVASANAFAHSGGRLASIHEASEAAAKEGDTKIGKAKSDAETHDAETNDASASDVPHAKAGPLSCTTGGPVVEEVGSTMLVETGDSTRSDAVDTLASDSSDDSNLPPWMRANLRLVREFCALTVAIVRLEARMLGLDGDRRDT